MKMRNGKSKVVILVAILVLTASVVAGFFIVRHVLSDAHENKLFEQQFSELNISTTPISEEERDEYTVAPELPRYIYIPAAGVDKARMVALGVKSPGKDNQQQLDAPKNIDDVGWYDCRINPIADKRCGQATLPGANIIDTATILTGHTCFSRTMNCVFDKISMLKRGDTIIIERGDGKKLGYAVKKVEVIKLEDVDMRKAMRPIESDKEGLTLMVCRPLINEY
jgi:LPXTG-site transpeptidase (sortase) family protein